MITKNFKGRCEKRLSTKAAGVCRLFSKLQIKFLEILEANDDVEMLRCNVPLDKANFCSDFLFEKKDGTKAIRECVERNHLTKPRTVEQLEFSRTYWAKHEITNWGIVTNKEDNDV